MLESPFRCPPPRLRGIRVYAALVLAAGAPIASAQTWHFTPSIDSLFTLTDNVKLAPSGDRTADFVTQFTPALKFTERSARTKVEGTIAAPVLLYARTGGENNDVEPQVDIQGIAEIVQRLFYVEASTNISQQFVSPFGARPQDLASATANRYTAQSYRVSPFLKGEAGGGLAYSLRDDNIWADQNNTSLVTGRSYTNEITGTLSREARPLGWAVDYDRTQTTFTGEAALRTQLERAQLLVRQDVTFEWSVSGGYEQNNYSGTDSADAIYGAGVKWRPSARTTVDANAEHRFFGASYHVSVDHRTPLSVWSIRASRDVTTYPQQLAALTGGDDVSALLNRLFSSRVSDPLQRQTLVDQLIRDRGLPAVLSGPLALFTQQVTLQESLQATAGLIGARNTVLATVFRLRAEPVSSTAQVPDVLLALDNNTQTGGNIVWTWKITPLYALATSADYVRTVENIADGEHSRQVILRTVLTAPLSPLTNALVGARWQRLFSNVGNEYRETAVFVGVRHIFR